MRFHFTSQNTILPVEYAPHEMEIEQNSDSDDDTAATGQSPNNTSPQDNHQYNQEDVEFRTDSDESTEDDTDIEIPTQIIHRRVLPHGVELRPEFGRQWYRQIPHDEEIK